MLRLIVNVFCYNIFREENLLIDFSPANIHTRLVYHAKRTQDAFFDVYDVTFTCCVRSFKVVCLLGCRDIGKLLNGQNAHFRFQPHRRNK